MKTVQTTLALVLALSITLPMMAQEKKTAKGKATQLSPMSRVVLRMEKLHNELQALDLSAEQKEKLGEIHKTLGPKAGEILGKLRSILTEEQQTTVEEAAKKAREAGKEGRDLFLAIQSSVKLDEEQQEKIDKLAEELATLNREMTKKALHILTPEQKEAFKKAIAPQPRKPREKTAKPNDKQ